MDISDKSLKVWVILLPVGLLLLLLLLLIVGYLLWTKYYAKLLTAGKM
jgi:hypothetical protein